MKHKIIQIAMAGFENTSQTQCNFVTTVLCEDGTLFRMYDNDKEWHKLPCLPVPTKEPPADADAVKFIMAEFELARRMG